MIICQIINLNLEKKATTEILDDTSVLVINTHSQSQLYREKIPSFLKGITPG
jgi:hypothetical protein